jgi:acetyl esterase/lipase
VHLAGTARSETRRMGGKGVGSGDWTPKWPSAYPAVRDMKAAVRFVRANAERFGVDPTKIAVSGGSAGATNAVATGVTFDADYKSELTEVEDPTLSTTHLNESSTVQCVYAHWSSDGEISLAQQHDPQNRTRYSAANAPIVEFHGTIDTTINISHAYAVQAEYNRTGVPYELHPLVGWAHGAWCYGCTTPCPSSPTTEYCPAMDEAAFPFITKHLGVAPSVR